MPGKFSVTGRLHSKVAHTEGRNLNSIHHPVGFVDCLSFLFLLYFAPFNFQILKLLLLPISNIIPIFKAERIKSDSQGFCMSLVYEVYVLGKAFHFTDPQNLGLSME